MVICPDGSLRCQRVMRGGALTSQDINMHTRVPTKAVINPLTVVLHTALETPSFRSSFVVRRASISQRLPFLLEDPLV